MSYKVKYHICHWKYKLVLDTAIVDNLGRVRLGYSGIRTSSGDVTKTQTSDPENSDPSKLFKKGLHCKVISILIT